MPLSQMFINATVLTCLPPELIQQDSSVPFAQYRWVEDMSPKVNLLLLKKIMNKSSKRYNDHQIKTSV